MNTCLPSSHETAVRLIDFAIDTGDLPTLAIAGAIETVRRHAHGAPLLRGLDTDVLRQLLDARFPGARAALPWLDLPPQPDGDDETAREFTDLLGLLLEGAAPGDGRHAEDVHALACAIATAALSDNHLWEDLQLPSRGALSALLNTHFGALARRNTGNMRWKAFFYRQLCERAGMVCRSPSCGACDDYEECFGPE